MRYPLHKLGKPEDKKQLRLYTLLFDADSPQGQRFEKWLIVAILASLLVVMADSVQGISQHAYLRLPLRVLEWGFTLLFTVEYVMRLRSVKHPLRYATSFYGIVDLLAILPTYLAPFFPEAAALITVRLLRLLRIFRILKLTGFIREYQSLGSAIFSSWRKIVVFLSVVLMVVFIMGSLMYVIEGPENGFTSIPVSVYWAITTMTTVGFGDLAPHTSLGRLISSMMMLLGWGTLAVPTGIVTSELNAQRMRQRQDARTCAACSPKPAIACTVGASLSPGPASEFQAAGSTGTAFQISFAYCAMVRSLENLPILATLMTALRIQLSWSR